MSPLSRPVKILLAVQLLTGAGFSLASPFLPLLVVELERPAFGSVELWAGAVFSAQALTSIVAAPLWGAIGDRLGHDKMLLRATLAAGVLMAAMAAVEGVVGLVALRALQGACSGTVAAVNAVAASACTREQTGRVFGLLQSTRWVGLVIGPLLGGLLAVVAGVRASLLLTGLAFVVAGGLVAAGVPASPRPAADGGARSPGVLATLGRALRRGELGRVHLLSFFNEAAATSLAPIVPLLVLSLVLAETEASAIVGLAMAVRAATSVAASYHYSRLGARVDGAYVLVLAAIGLFACYVPLGLVQSAWQLVGLLAVLGVAVGYLVPSIAALVGRLVEPEEIGSAYGINSSVTALARAVAPLLAAAVASAFGLRAALGLSAALCGVTAVLALQAWRRLGRPR